ncbi:iron ABC transporter permease [Aquibacillus sp. 3ASR75-11]|uniref:Iron ABC transporter permease n=1 Tax=Terrihalobacillus insolitus TaxID=2950438 RepID=A0A9X4AKQ9_9BACI|nr:iron ABC transporter permease [Terrihalobacillus insolitus]MDC3411943.1 iron ABC transporter permease [Terrihalobacillus insolitus]MDC3423371.1 iron ABC transporter permease [Terrihalobacillus insolitus]
MEAKNARTKIIFFTIGILLLLLLSILASLRIGTASIDFETIFLSFFSSEETKDMLIIQNLRVPRTLIAVIIGASLAIAGAIMQAITLNPLASPQIFGVNAGASLVVVISTVLLPSISPSSLVYFAFIGSVLGGSIVYYMASTGGGTSPIKLALAGITVHLFLSAIIEGIVLFNEDSTESVLFWLAGAIDATSWADVKTIWPWATVGILLAILLARQLTILGMGDDTAQGLGQNVTAIRLCFSLLVVILAGASVAVAGPIGFIGLIIPHIVRKLVGVDYRVIIPLSGLFGALLLVSADVLSRFIAFPAESPVGIVTAMLGAPYFLYLARKGGREA